jgi:hypothetical protein
MIRYGSSRMSLCVAGTLVLVVSWGCGSEGARDEPVESLQQGIAGAGGSGSEGSAGGPNCETPPPCYPLNRVWSPGTPGGCPCMRWNSGACTDIPGHLVSYCGSMPSTCGYLYCIPD